MVQVNPHRCFIHHKWEDNTGLCDGNHSKLSCCSHKSPGVRTCLPYTLELRKVLKVTGRDTSLRDTSPCIFRALGRHECHQPGGVSTSCSPPHGCVTPLHIKHPARFSLALGVQEISRSRNTLFVESPPLEAERN